MNNLYEKFDIDLLRAFIFSKSVAINLKCSEITPNILMIGIILSGPNVATEILTRMNVKLDLLLHKIRESVEINNKNHNNYNTCPIYNDIKTSVDAKGLFRASTKFKNNSGDKVLGIQHVLASLFQERYFDNFIESEKLDKENIKKMLSLAIILGQKEEEEEDDDLCGVSASGSFVKKSSKKNKKDILNSFFVDLTKSAAEGKLDPVIGRDEEIEQIISVLCRKRKNNPILVGYAGVGKTAIVEGLAQRIASGSIPPALKNKKVLLLILSSVVADTQYRGQFEEKMNNIIKMFKESKDYICFIDEMHSILGAGNAVGCLDAGNILKPSLAKGDFKCIGATTEDEYYKFFSKDSALQRRFQKINIAEPSLEDTKKILYGIKDGMEKHHNCIVSNDAIDAAVKLAEHYVRDKYFPDKSIDLIDDACARFANIERSDFNKDFIVNGDHVAKIVSSQQHIPYDAIVNSYTDKILNLKEIIKKVFIGQEESIENIYRNIKNAHIGLRIMDAPIYSFIFVGPSGTGKTYLAEKLSEIIFPQKDSFIRINMTEFTEPHSVSKLIGSPPGYVGFGEKNQLTDKVLRRPYCLILLDEIDKAHPNVLKLFMQILSRGTLTDAKGKDVSFKQSIVIMTTNIGGESSSKHTLGFGTSQNDGNKDKTISLCKKLFGVEFVNRVGSIAVFNSFSNKELDDLARLFLKNLSDRLGEQKKIKLSYDDNIIDKILEESKKMPGVNANPIEDIVMKSFIPTIISNYIIGVKKSVKKIHLTLKNNEIIIKK